MLLINLITGVCFALMMAGVISVVLNLFFKKRADAITYVRGFKKGKGALIYIYALPLLWIGIVYAGQPVFYGFFLAVREVSELLFLKYSIASVKALIDANAFYGITMYMTFVLVFLNAILFAFSLASQYLWNFFTNLKFKFSKKEKLILFGDNEQNHMIYNSEKKRAKILVDQKITGEKAVALYLKAISYQNLLSFETYVSKRVNECAKDGKSFTVVVNTGKDETNIALGRSFVEAFAALEKEERQACFGKLRVFLFGNPQYEGVFRDIVGQGFGCISYINKYQKIAMDFVDRYPLTHFMTGEQIDYETSLVKEDVEVNVLMIGFGKTNQQIFLTSVANNQLITKGKDGVRLKTVHYHLFDKDPTENNKNLNHNYYRYQNECESADPKEYLPLPDDPAKMYSHFLDINDVHFYNEIKRILTASPKNVNFIVIAFGSDLENIDMAEKLLEKSKEWDVTHLTLFVKVRKDQNYRFVERENCYLIADESKAVYDIESIVSDRIFRMARLRDEVYAIESAVTKKESEEQGRAVELPEETVQKIKQDADLNWYQIMTQNERDSNLYCCLSLRSKLNLMGLDYCPKEDDTKEGISEAEYLSIYAKDDLPDTSYYHSTVDGKPIVHYTIDFADSRRRNLAIHEHLRWNSYMISRGTIPATRDQILNEMRADNPQKHSNGKNYALRRHGNLTTFEGLLEFRKMIAERDKTTEENTDVIKYDYQLLDDAYWFLDATGQKIYKR